MRANFAEILRFYDKESLMVRFHQVDDGVNETKQQLSGMLAPTLAL